jgi:hypothetical protein
MLVNYTEATKLLSSCTSHFRTIALGQLDDENPKSTFLHVRSKAEAIDTLFATESRTQIIGDASPANQELNDLFTTLFQFLDTLIHAKKTLIDKYLIPMNILSHRREDFIRYQRDPEAVHYTQDFYFWQKDLLYIIPSNEIAKYLKLADEYIDKTSQFLKQLVSEGKDKADEFLIRCFSNISGLKTLTPEQFRSITGINQARIDVVEEQILAEPPAQEP